MTQSNLTHLLNIKHLAEIKPFSQSSIMKVAIALLAIALLPALAYAQTTDTGSQLGLELLGHQPTFYLDDEGYTVVVGEIKNLKNFAVTDVRVLANYYTEESGNTPDDTGIGNTIINVIPPLGTSPYIIRSNEQNLDVTGVTVNLLGFTSSPSKSEMLELTDTSVRVVDALEISGTMTNNSPTNILEVRIFALVYDALDPPRLIVIETTTISPVAAGESSEYRFILDDYERASTIQLVAESDHFTSAFSEIPIIRHLTQPLIIHGIEIVDANGNAVSSLHKNVPVYLQSRITGQDVIDIEYEYLVQVNTSEPIPIVEFVGSTAGLMSGAGISQSVVEWTPQNSGLFYVEMYVWSPEGLALSTPGPIALLHVRD